MDTVEGEVLDPILAELNGALGKPTDAVKGEFISGQEQPPSLEKQLEAEPPPAASSSPAPRAQLLDKTHSIKAGGNGYEVIVEGEYYEKSVETKGNIIRKYKLAFNLPALTNSRNESALGMIIGASRPGGGLLKAALKKAHPLAQSYRTHAITKITPLNGAPAPTGIMYMEFETLKKWVRLNLPGFPVDVETYWNVGHLREDVVDFKTNVVTDVTYDKGTQGERTVKGGFGLKKTSAERIKERHDMRIEEHELAEMNVGIVDE